MTDYLIAISVGPVQEFIKAARRTRDLWFGSYLLSLVSHAVASALKQQGAKPIFPPDSPASGNPAQGGQGQSSLITDIDARLNEIKKSGRFDQNLPQIANVIIAEIATEQPAQIVKTARGKAAEAWRTIAEAARDGAPSTAINITQWKRQIDDVLEFYAAWVPFDGKNYPQARARLMRLLAGRKNCRDFRQAPGDDDGLPKSSLDGLRPTVLTERENWPSGTAARLRLRQGEQLDVVGVVKRLGGGKRPYPSVSRVAADPWIRGMQKKKPDKFEQFVKEVEALARTGSGAGSVVHELKEFPQYKSFPYEGTPVFRSRHHEWEEECGLDPQVLRPLQNALAQLPEPFPYLAVLVADGDRMGQTISSLDTPEKNREFSRALAGFSDAVKDIVKEHQGVLVYAGGDDVLAFVPVDKCLRCARELHCRFAQALSKYQTNGQPPTLSVGIAIGHFLENLEDLLEYGRAAERDAKEPDRNGLAIHVYKRGGAPLRFRTRWQSGSGTCHGSSSTGGSDDPVDQILEYVQWILDEAIPRGFPYELRELIEIYRGWNCNKAVVLEALRADALRLLAAKQPASASSRKGEIRDRMGRFSEIEEFEQFARALLVARQIAEAFRLS